MSTVIVTYGNDANRWAEQYCRRPAWTRSSEMPRARGARHVQVIRSMTRQGIVAAIESAARTAGAGGEVIYSVGHGNGASVGATAQLGVGSELTINEEILSADANGQYTIGAVGRVTLSATDQEINVAFRRIGAALANAHVARFTFLVCVLGNNRRFLERVKAVWGGTVAVAGYTAYVATSEITMTGDRTYPRISLYLSRDSQGMNIVHGTDAEPQTFLELHPESYLTVV